MNQEIKEKEISRMKNRSILIESIIYILFFLGPLTGNVILVLFGILSGEFDVSPSSISIAIPSFMFPFAIIQLFSGAISDIKGRVPVIIFGLSVFGVGMLVAATSSSLIMFLIANILGGFGFGFVNPVLIALMTDITPGQDIPKKMGYLGSAANLGVAIGPILAGFIVIIGWRFLYLLFILITGISLLILIGLKRAPQRTSKVSEFRLFLSHLFQELRRFVVILMIISAFLSSQTYLAIIVWTSRAFTHVIDETLAGIIIGSAGIMGASTGILIGYLIIKKGVGIAILIGIISLYIGLMILLLISDITNNNLLLFTTLGLMFIGVAGGSLIPSIMYYSQTLSKERRGALAGLATAGQFIGIALVPIIYDSTFHDKGIKMVYFTVFIISIFLIIVFSLLYTLGKRTYK
ncbi:MAG: MFS transporter [Promethearchaeota archaeon]